MQPVSTPTSLQPPSSLSDRIEGAGLESSLQHERSPTPEWSINSFRQPGGLRHFAHDLPGLGGQCMPNLTMEVPGSQRYLEGAYYRLGMLEKECITQKEEILILRYQLQLAQEEQLDRTYVAVLIDGNAFLPAGNLARFGDDGGRNLAHFIADYAAKQCAQHRAGRRSAKVVTGIYADVQGLATAYYNAGVVQTAGGFHDFVYGFNHFGIHSDIIDIGPVHRFADERIRSQLLHCLNDKRCCHIILGCRADSYIVPLLQQTMMDSRISSRIILLVAAPHDQHPALSHLVRAYLPTVFVTGVQYLEKGFAERPCEAPTRETTNGQIKSAANGAHSQVGYEESYEKSNSAFINTMPTTLIPGIISSFDLDSGHDSASPSIVASISDPINGSHVAESAWSRVASRAAKLPFKDMRRKPRMAKASGKEILLNAEGRRLDHPVAYDAQKVADMKKLKYCNQHYIGKGCCHYICGNNNCPHRHDDNLSREDKKWLRLVARETVCKKGTACRDPECIYGHQCPYLKSGPGSMCVNGHACRFKMMHGMDLVIASRISSVDAAKEEPA